MQNTLFGFNSHQMTNIVPGTDPILKNINQHSNNIIVDDPARLEKWANDVLKNYVEKRGCCMKKSEISLNLPAPQNIQGSTFNEKYGIQQVVSKIQKGLCSSNVTDCDVFYMVYALNMYHLFMKKRKEIYGTSAGFDMAEFSKFAPDCGCMITYLIPNSNFNSKGIPSLCYNGTYCRGDGSVYLDPVSRNTYSKGGCRSNVNVCNLSNNYGDLTNTGGGTLSIAASLTANCSQKVNTSSSSDAPKIVLTPHKNIPSIQKPQVSAAAPIIHKIIEKTSPNLNPPPQFHPSITVSLPHDTRSDEADYIKSAFEIVIIAVIIFIILYCL